MNNTWNTLDTWNKIKYAECTLIELTQNTQHMYTTNTWNTCTELYRLCVTNHILINLSSVASVLPIYHSNHSTILLYHISFCHSESMHISLTVIIIYTNKCINNNIQVFSQVFSLCITYKNYFLRMQFTSVSYQFSHNTTALT